MATILLFFLFNLLSFPSTVHLQLKEEAFISSIISDKGLDFAKELLIKKVLSTLTPLKVPPVEKSVKIPVVGKAHIMLSNITINEVDVSSSYVKPGQIGLVIVASGATANLSMNWLYSCSTWLVPVPISDQGDASVQVEGMEVGLTLRMENQEGTLRLALLDCGCFVKNMSIKLNGGASWLYQGLLDAFEGQIESSIENAISNKIREGVMNLGFELQNLPKEIPVNNFTTLNVTFVNDFVLTNSSIGFEINGLLTTMDQLSLTTYNHEKSLLSNFCIRPTMMVEISIHQNVINSALLALFTENLITWIVDEVPDQVLLNTAGWRFVIPQLFKQYPNDDIVLKFYASSSPIASILDNNIYATIFVDIIINVLDAGDVIPVICFTTLIDSSGFVEISRKGLTGTLRLDDFTLELKWSKVGNFHMHLVQLIDSSGFVEISRNDLTDTLRLDDFTLELKWSKVGNFHMHLVQLIDSSGFVEISRNDLTDTLRLDDFNMHLVRSVVWTILKIILFPYDNLRLGRGFPLPILHGFGFQNA